MGDHQPYTITTKDFGSKKGFQMGWCTNCQNLREQQNVYHPQDYNGDVHHGFCGGGARIVGFDSSIRQTDPFSKPPFYSFLSITDWGTHVRVTLGHLNKSPLSENWHLALSEKSFF